MCLTCGCELPYESHGDPRNITVQDIKEATAPMVANGESADEAVRNLVKTWKLVKEKDKNYKYANDLKKVFKHAARH